MAIRAAIVAFSVAAASAWTSDACAEVSPQKMSGAGGMASINAYSPAYLPRSSTVPVALVGMEGRVSSRWSLLVRSASVSDQSFSGVAAGGSYNFRTYKTTTVDGPLSQVRTTVIPAWHAKMSLAVGRWQYSALMTSTNLKRTARQRETPIKASVFGFQLGASLSHAFSEKWSGDADYQFIYGSASGLSIIGHLVTVGPSYWF